MEGGEAPSLTPDSCQRKRVKAQSGGARIRGSQEGLFAFGLPIRVAEE